MILGTVQLRLHDDLEERVESDMLDFPCLIRRMELDGYAYGFLPWHWHSCFEFIVVESGALELIVESGNFMINAGDGCFINADVLHCFRPEGGKGVAYHVHQFSREFIGGLNLIDRKYVFPVASCGGLDALWLSRNEQKQAEMLDLLDKTYALAGAEPYCYELQMRALLTQMWLLLLQSARPALETGRKPSNTDSDRIKHMLTYIEEHISEELNPSAVAASAGVSVRECHRCFQKVLGITPASYVNDRRISRSLELLSSTDDTVTQIAAACGFSTSSYFAKCFKTKLRLSPLAYRKEIRA